MSSMTNCQWQKISICWIEYGWLLGDSDLGMGDLRRLMLSARSPLSELQLQG